MNEDLAADFERSSTLMDNVALCYLTWVGLFALLVFMLCIRFPSIKGSFFPPNLVSTNGNIKEVKAPYFSHKGGGDYCGVVVYSYRVQGQEYQNDLISFKGGRPCAETQDEALSRVEEYKVDSQVVVYYDESDPTFSVLKPEETMQKFDLWFICINLILVLLTSVVTHFHKKKRKRFKDEMEQKWGFKWY